MSECVSVWANRNSPYVSQVGIAKNPKGCGYFDVCPIESANDTVHTHTCTTPYTHYTFYTHYTLHAHTHALRPTRTHAQVDYRIVSKAVETISLAARMDRPFFIGVGLIRPHLPFIAPQELNPTLTQP